MKTIHALAMRQAFLMAALCSGCSAATSSSRDLGARDDRSSLTAPELRAVTPAIASNAGGISWFIEGANFVDGVTVTVNGVPAKPDGPTLSSSLFVTLPAQPGVVGQVPVVVTNPDGKMVSRSDVFAYSAALSSWLAVGKAPSAVVVGDFNADGNADFAVANHDSVDVSFRFGNGQGGFAASQTLPVGIGPLVLATADFNRDGVVDLAVLGAPNVPNPANTSLDIVLGARTGKLALVSPGITNEGALCLAAGDWNGDGKADLASFSFAALGDGTGGFGPPISMYNTIGSAYWMAPGDLNGDGKLDLLIFDNRSFSPFLGDGTGTFRRTNSAYYPGVYSSLAVLKDVNGDGKADVVANNSAFYQESGNIAVLLNDGMGGFGINSPLIRNNHRRSDGVVVADFDGDGKPDLAVTNYYDTTVSVHRPHGNPHRAT